MSDPSCVVQISLLQVCVQAKAEEEDHGQDREGGGRGVGTAGTRISCVLIETCISMCSEYPLTRR